MANNHENTPNPEQNPDRELDTLKADMPKMLRRLLLGVNNAEAEESADASDALVVNVAIVGSQEHLRAVGYDYVAFRFTSPTPDSPMETVAIDAYRSDKEERSFVYTRFLTGDERWRLPPSEEDYQDASETVKSVITALKAGMSVEDMEEMTSNFNLDENPMGLEDARELHVILSEALLDAGVPPESPQDIA